MRRAYLALTMAILSGSGGAAAADPGEAQWRQLHMAVCAGKLSQADGQWGCSKARAYPGHDTCPIQFDQNRALIFHGRFTEPAPQALAVYQAECEPHANNFGGMALFRVEAGRFVLQRYYPGLVATACAVIPGDERDIAYCASSYMGQGQQVETFGPLEFDAAGEVGWKDWFRAGNMDGFYGSVVVNCTDAAFDAHHIIGVAADGGDVVVEAATVDPQAREAACAGTAAPRQSDPAGDTEDIPPPPGSAFVADGALLKARLRFHPPSDKPEIELIREPTPARQ